LVGYIAFLPALAGFFASMEKRVAERFRIPLPSTLPPAAVIRRVVSSLNRGNELALYFVIAQEL